MAEQTVTSGSMSIEAGTRVIAEAGVVFERIIDSVQSFSRQVEDIADTTGQLNDGIENVAAASEQQTSSMEVCSRKSVRRLRL